MKNRIIDYKTVRYSIVFLLIGLYPLLSIVNLLTNSIGIVTSIDTVIVYVSALILFIIYLVYNSRKILYNIIYPIVYLIVLFSSMLIHNDFTYFFNGMNDFLLNTVYFFIGATFVYNEPNKRTLKNASIFSIVASFSILVLQNIFFGGSLQGDMTASYILVLPVFILILNFFNERNRLILACILVGIITLFSYGTRGPLLSLVIFIILFYLSFRNVKHRIYLIIIFAIMIIFNEYFVDIIIILFKNIGADRLFDIFVNGQFLEGGGREEIYIISMNQIIASPVLGLGLYGDRIFLASIEASYPHNLFLEVFLQFGIVVGAFLTALFTLFYATKFSKMNLDLKKFIFALSILVGVKLMITGSYLNERLLFFLIGVLIKEGNNFNESSISNL